MSVAGRDQAPASTIDLSSIMEDESISESCSLDSARITEIYPVGEIYGGVNPDDGRALYHLAASFKPQRILEIGASTAFIAAALQRHAGDKVRLTTLDITDVNAADAAWSICGLPKPPAGFLERLSLALHLNFEVLPVLWRFQSQIVDQIEAECVFVACIEARICNAAGTAAEIQDGDCFGKRNALASQNLGIQIDEVV